MDLMLVIAQIISAFLISSIITMMAIPVIVRISVIKKLVDTPNRRKVNKTPIPNLGGVAFFIGILIATFISLNKLPFTSFRYITVAMITMFAIGLKDDILVISPKKKFGAQAISAFILTVFGDIRFTDLHGFLGIHGIDYISSILFSSVVIIGIINAINLIDGIDGLASGLVILIAIMFGVQFFEFGHIGYSILCTAIVGGLMSFTAYNVFGKKNKIFMGDTGSLVLGVLVTVLSIAYNENAIGTEQYTYSPAFSLAVISIPVCDLIRVFFKRILRHKSPFSPDMDHIHHKFLRLGLSHLKTSVFIISINIAIIFIIYLLRHQDIYLQLGVLLLFGILLPYIPKTYAKIFRVSFTAMQMKTVEKSQ
jgi:UDP-N-acetylmuramyl pentapeptide phosphotransferase/UDP-N-acetylglucosamine-1-phosphate transferase